MRGNFHIPSNTDQYGEQLTSHMHFTTTARIQVYMIYYAYNIQVLW